MAERDEKPPAVVLLSGGLDSATALACCVRDGFAPHALSFDYGQRHRHELAAADRVAEAGGVVRHETVRLDLSRFGGSALTADLAVPKDRDEAAMGAGVPITYVPARNTVFLSVALGWAEILGAREIYCGVNAVDYSGYPDCRPEFLRAFETLANLATKAGVEGDPENPRFQIRAPLVELTKAAIIRLGVGLGRRLFAHAHSCYDPAPGGAACGRCDSCALRRSGFAAAGVPDPTVYRAGASKRGGID